MGAFCIIIKVKNNKAIAWAPVRRPYIEWYTVFPVGAAFCRPR